MKLSQLFELSTVRRCLKEKPFAYLVAYSIMLFDSVFALCYIFNVRF